MHIVTHRERTFGRSFRRVEEKIGDVAAQGLIGFDQAADTFDTDGRAQPAFRVQSLRGASEIHNPAQAADGEVLRHLRYRLIKREFTAGSNTFFEQEAHIQP